MRNWFHVVLIFLCAFLLQKTAFADDVIEVPQDELAQESVYPLFDRPTSVKNRNVVSAGHFDANIFYGLALTEPIANVSKLGLSVYYNLTEDHSLGFLYEKNLAGLSSYANQLHQEYGLDFSRAPKPVSTMMVDYNLKAYYGKMSMTKSTVLNLSLFGSLAAGMVQYQQKSYPAIALGLGQKFFFTNHFAFRADLRLYVHQAPIPFLDHALRDGTGTKPGGPDPVPTSGQFQERLTYTTNLDAGFSYLF